MRPMVWCTFRLEDRLYGIDAQRVQEVLGAADVSRLPLAPAGVRGLINLRGQIVAALDLRVCLGVPGVTPPAGTPHIVIAHHPALVSLVVDAVCDVERTAAGAVQSAPETLHPAMRELVVGAVPLERELLLILDLDRVMEVAMAA